jgi:hypothetical protein
MNDIDAQIKIYRKRDQDKVKKMKDEREAQRSLWTYINYPQACWLNRLQQMRKFWDGEIRG